MASATASAAPEPPIAVLLGLPFHDLTMGEALVECERALTANEPCYFVTANVDFAAQAYENSDLREILFYAKRVLCDGMPLVWISRVLGMPLRERVAGADLTPKMLELCARMRKRVYFFGSDQSTLERVAGILRERHPDLEIAGYESPPMGSIDDWDNDAVIKRIREANTDLLLIALGCPKQENWIARFHKQTGVSLAVGIGASLDFIAGKQIRAPRIVQKTGMEWFWRMATNPKRLFSRYWRDFTFLAWVTAKQRLSMRGAQTGSVRESLPVAVAETGAPNAPGQPDYSAAEAAETPGKFLRLDWSGAAERARLAELAQPTDYTQPILLGLADVSFIDSAGLGALAGIGRRARNEGVTFAILNPSKPVVDALNAVHMLSLFSVVASEAEFAEKAARPPAGKESSG